MRRFRRGGGRKKVPQQWCSSPAGYGTPLTFTLGAGPAPIVLAGATGVAASFDPPIIQRFTVMAVRGEVLVNGTNSSSSQPAIIRIAFGIIISQESSSGILLPSPLSQLDAGQSWLWLRHYDIALPAGIVGAGIFLSGLLYDVDHVLAKSKRIVKEQQQLVMMTQAVLFSGGGTTSVTITPFLRTLIRKVA